MKILSGQYYVTSEGHIFGPMEEDLRRRGARFRARMFRRPDVVMCFTGEGANVGSSSRFDLVRQLTELDLP